MAPQASKQATETYAARDWREKRDTREKRNPKFRVRSSENSALRTQHSELPIGSCTSNGIDSEEVLGTFSILAISSLSQQSLAQRKKRFLKPFSCPFRRSCRGWHFSRISRIMSFSLLTIEPLHLKETFNEEMFLTPFSSHRKVARPCLHWQSDQIYSSEIS